MQYTSLAGNNISYSSLLVTNVFWSGAFTVYKLGEFSNIYIGYGNRSFGGLFYPLSPGNIEKDPEGRTEYREPNPDKEPEIIEEDTDKEDENEMDG